MTFYLYDRPDWPDFRWNGKAVASALAEAHIKQGRLQGRLADLGVTQRNEATLRALTQEVVKSSEIEGEILDPDAVRSSIARRLGIDAAGLSQEDRRVEGVVEMTLEATQNFRAPLSRERLFAWHRLLFPGATHIRVGAWRDDAKGPMQVVSGAIGNERVHYEAPQAERVEVEMQRFLDWTSANAGVDPLLAAAQAHLWFVTVHPLDDGNGRIARAIADLFLCRSEGSPSRGYSMSAQIRRERKEYYASLESIQKGTLDVTDWMRWFLACLSRSLDAAEAGLETVLRKGRFWKSCADLPLNERQRRMLNMLLDGAFVGKLTSTKWGLITKCSHDTASRDIADLIEHGLLRKDPGGGRSTSYSLSGEVVQNPVQ